MKLKSIKTLAEIEAALFAPQSIDRPPVEITEINGSITQVRIAGLTLGADYGLKVLVEQPFTEDTRVRAIAQVAGFEPRVEYFTEYDGASAFKDAFDPNVDVKLDTGVKVLVDDHGNVIREVGEGAAGIQPDMTF